MMSRFHLPFFICLIFIPIFLLLTTEENLGFLNVNKIKSKSVKTINLSTNNCHDYDEKGYWKKTKYPILPLRNHPYFCQKEIDYQKLTGRMIDKNELKYIWKGPGCDMKIYNSTHVKTIFKKKIWIHLEGDSLFRHMYENIRDYFYQKCFPKLPKTVQTSSFEIGKVFVSFKGIWYRFYQKKCEKFAFAKGRIAPDVLITNMGLHYLQHEYEKINATMPLKYDEQIECLNSQAKPLNKTVKIFWLTTPSTKFGIDRIKRLNEIAHETLDTSLWQFVDVWNLLYTRYNMLATQDKVHFYGLGSKWMANIMLNAIAKEFNKEGTYEN